MLSKSVNWALKKKKNQLTLIFLKKYFFIMHFLKTPLFEEEKKTQFQEAESNSPLMIM